MAAVHKENMESKTSSDTEVLPEKVSTPSSDEKLKEEDEVEHLNYPQPWKFEKWFLGGYSQGRMIKFKSPKTMYKAINLFAGMTVQRSQKLFKLIL